MLLPVRLRRFQSLFVHLWLSFSPRRRKQLLGLQLLGLLTGLSEVANLGVLLPFLRILANPYKNLKGLGPFTLALQRLPENYLLLTLGLGFMLVVAVSTLLRVLTIRSQLRIAALISADMGEQVFASVLQQPYAWHLRTNSSTVLSFLTRDVDAVFACVQALLVFVMNAIIVILLGGALITLAPAVMFVVILVLGSFYLIVFRVNRSSLKIDGAIVIKEYQRSMQIVQEGLGGIRDILIDRSQATFLSSFSKSNRKRKLADAGINIKSQVPRYLIEGFSMILIVGVSVALSLQGQGIERLLPILGTLALGAYRLLQPLQQCFGAVNTLQGNSYAVERVYLFLGQRGIIQPLSIVNNLSHHQLFSSHSMHPLVRFEGVSFRYVEDQPFVLRDLQLDIHVGERLAFVGTTGSGKTTTSDIILGLLKPTQGTLYVGGEDLYKTPGLLENWQASVAHVPQSIYLTDDSFSANIAFGVPDHLIDLERVRNAAQDAKIADLIENSSYGYSTQVGERGIRLSGGQRQRIGIARALYKRSKLLVLDEATSALDNRTEKEVMEAIESLDRNITVILIAHRLTTLAICDRVVLLENGRIAGLGSYSELMSCCGAFQRMANNSTETNTLSQ